MHSFAQKDSVSTKKKYKLFLVPSSLVALGLYSRLDVPLGRNRVREFRNQHFSTFHTSIDEYLQYAPIGFAYGLGVLPNTKSKNNFVNKSVLLFKSEVLMAVTTFSLKEIIRDKRPNTNERDSWPSGHTAQAFVAASFLDHEYRHKSIWISIGSYSTATAVALIRVLNDRHWSADVLAGAGIGILATKIAYLTHQHKWKNLSFFTKNKLTILPYFQNKGAGVFISTKL